MGVRVRVRVRLRMMVRVRVRIRVRVEFRVRVGVEVGVEKMLPSRARTTAGRPSTRWPSSKDGRRVRVSLQAKGNP